MVALVTGCQETANYIPDTAGMVMGGERVSCPFTPTPLGQGARPHPPGIPQPAPQWLVMGASEQSV